jgi:hypothetical protein
MKASSPCLKDEGKRYSSNSAVPIPISKAAIHDSCHHDTGLYRDGKTGCVDTRDWTISARSGASYPGKSITICLISCVAKALKRRDPKNHGPA